MWNIFSWLFSVVIVSFLVNVASAYAMPHIDKFLGRFSDYQRVRNEKKKEKIDFEINWMLDDHQYFLLKLSDRTNNITLTYIFTAIFLLSTLFPAVFPGIERLGAILKELVGYPEAKSSYFGFARENLSVFTLIFSLSMWLSLTLGLMFATFIHIRRYQTDEIIVREYFKRKLTLILSQSKSIDLQDQPK